MKIPTQLVDVGHEIPWGAKKTSSVVEVLVLCDGVGRYVASVNTWEAEVLVGSKLNDTFAPSRS